MDSKKKVSQLTQPLPLPSTLPQGKTGRSNQENRRDIRKSYFMAVDYATDDRLHQEFINDISCGGVYIETRQPLPVGQKISLSFALPDQQTHIKVSGGVVRSDAKGIGVAFLTTDSAVRSRIAAAVADL